MSDLVKKLKQLRDTAEELGAESEYDWSLKYQVLNQINEIIVSVSELEKESMEATINELGERDV